MIPWNELLVHHFGARAAGARIFSLGSQFDRHWRIELPDRLILFAKTAPPAALDRFAAEADGLTALAAPAVIRIPRPYAYGLWPSDPQHAQTAYLLLEWLELHPLSPAHAETAARALVELHRAVSYPDRFGWRRDNYIGATPQHNGWEVNWAHFFIEKRLKPQLAWARARGFSPKAANRLEELFTAIPALFLDYNPQPALLHGDLWSGNIAETDGGEIALFDPAVHQGDHESELAMMELFGGLPNALYAAYRRLTHLDRNYERRKPLYTLYHILNHYNLFGGAYAREAERLIDRLSASLH
ncbi:MAG: fructosamine kinase family protein [Hydrogenophilus sp.]|nr:fructosamine kinase family protein [Hydrogenophilus sp.]